MKLLNQARKEWPDERIKKDLSERSSGRETTWFIFKELELYGSRDSDGTEHACADDDEIRNMAIIEFLKRNGGTYVLKP